MGDVVVGRTGEEIRVDLPLEGMSCASCAARIERGLQDVDGVADAHVNFGTRRATVRFDPTRTGTAELRATIESLGYGAPDEVADDPTIAETAGLRRRLVPAVVLTLPVL